MELNQLHYPFAEQASQINGFVLKEKKGIYCWTRLRPTRPFGESNDQVRVQIPTCPRQVRDDRKMSRVQNRVWYYSPI